MKTSDENSFMKSALFAKRDGNKIFGIIYRPVCDENNTDVKFPAVIYSHGIGGSFSNGEEYAAVLAKAGYVVYCFDFCGGSMGSRSEGSVFDMSVFSEQKDLESVLCMVKDLDYVDENQIFLLGASQGGVVSAMTASSHCEDIAGMILLYPAFVLFDDAKRMFGSLENVPDTVSHMGMTLGRAYYERLFVYDIYENIQKYPGDVLIIHGGKDEIVPVRYAERAQKMYPSAVLHVLPGAGHGFSGSDDNKAIKWMLQYLENKRKITSETMNMKVEDNEKEWKDCVK